MGAQPVGFRPVAELSSGVRHLEDALFLEAGEGEAVASADAGFLEDVFEVDLDSAGADAEFACDLFILEALFDEFEDLLFARCEFGARVAFRAGGFAEQGILHPVGAAGDGAEAGEQGVGIGGFAEDAFDAALEQAESLGLGNRVSPNDEGGGGLKGAQFREPLENGLGAEGLVEDQQVGLKLTDQLGGGDKRIDGAKELQVGGGVENGADAFGGDGLSLADSHLFPECGSFSHLSPLKEASGGQQANGCVAA